MPLDRTGLVRLVVLTVSTCLPPALLNAQTCDPQTGTVTGSVAVADGSTALPSNPPGNQVQVNPVPSYPMWWTGPLPGSVTVTAFPGVPLAGQGSSTYTFEGGAAGYLSEAGGSATCHREGANQCIHCGGSFSLNFYSAQGTVEGVVTWEDGAPFATTVFADGLWQAPSDPTTGKYRFAQAGAPIENNWGLPVSRTGSSGPGTATHSILPFGFPNQFAQNVTIFSNSVGHADFQLPRNETDPRYESCSSSESGPSPQASPANSGPEPTAVEPTGTVGLPVSVTTGNVQVDQTDAVVPGLGLGLNFSRSYNSHNSADPDRHGVFGPGWSHSYEKRLTFPSPDLIKLRETDGTPHYFQDADHDGVYAASAPYTKANWIVVSGTVYTRQFAMGGQEVFDRLTPSGPGARLVSLANAAGAVTSLTYSAGKLSAIADPGGRQLTLGYTGAQLTSLSGPAGLIATFTYAGSTLGSVTYADGDGDGQPDSGYTFAYHGANGKLHTVTDRGGTVVETHEYDATGRASATSVSNGVNGYTLDYRRRNTTLVTDTLGNMTRYEWVKIWGKQRIVRITGPCTACDGSDAPTHQWAYDNRGRVISYTDGEGDLTLYQYDQDGRLVTVEAQVSSQGATVHTTTYDYDASGRVVKGTAPNGATTVWTYLPAGPHTITEDVSPGVTRTTTIDYLPSGKPKFVRDAMNRETELHYNALGDLDWTEDPLSHRISFQYDAMGRREKTQLPGTSPANDSPITSYDTLGRVWRVTNPNGSYWRFTYDGGGRRTSLRDPLDQHTNFAYDSYGRLLTVTDALLLPTGYQYDAMSNLRYLTDARLKVTEFQYDAYNRLKKTIFPGPRAETYTYDLAGRLRTRTDRKGVVTTYSYDGLSRLLRKDYSNGSPAVVFTYDTKGDVGYLTMASSAADSLAWDFNLAGQALSEFSSRNGTTVEYGYAQDGQRAQVRLNGTTVLTYGYDGDGRLDTITRGAGVVFDLNLDAAHRRQGLVYPNGTTTEYGYDLLSRLSSIRLKRGATILDDITQESNDLNDLTSRTENGTRLEYDHDPLSRLTAVDRTLPQPTVAQETYGYDEVGNRLTALGVAGTWAYSDRNELLSYGGTSRTYDLNGNTTSRSDGPTIYEWDVENRLQHVVRAGTEAKYEYDPFGRRVTKKTGAGSTSFAYDGEDVLFEQGPSGSILYLHGPGIDEPLASEADGVRTYLHADGLGSVVKRTDAAGNVIESSAYESFGKAAGLLNGYAFTGREWDSEASLYYYRDRYYDATAGRFLSEDPKSTQDETNLFAYVFNNPVTWVDPTGNGAVPPSPPPTSPAPPGPCSCTSDYTCLLARLNPACGPPPAPKPQRPPRREPELQTCRQWCRQVTPTAYAFVYCNNDCPLRELYEPGGELLHIPIEPKAFDTNIYNWGFTPLGPPR